MTTWHRTDSHGTNITMAAVADSRGYIVMTPEMFAMLMKDAGWSKEREAE